ncbi:hypothetical protein N7466_010677 [Penicillium verhagenii]|uniref:uncharacterized protein n=1 Tax=Penicillium verhagenii TaxID=1562060 RepID=UPI002545972A|nr:uncharacterized protein N7466_010677 [Penicillium verhagenii]KAJ5917123.1 hypothetical protein N7466_010677 [Penicillium verhagenii]
MDNSGPRKRRRPALSCVSCRRRKVKCDRKTPCGQCMLLPNSKSCTYTDDDCTILYEQSPRPDTEISPQVSKLESGILNQSRNSTCGEHQAPGEDVSLAQRESHKDARPQQPQNNIETIPSAPESQKQLSAPTSILGTMSKTRIFGRGHWMSSLSSAERLRSTLDPLSIGVYTPQQPTNDPSGLYDVVRKCKQLARDIKSQRPSRSPLSIDVYQTLPNHAVTEELVQLYFDSFESCFRILHRPSFRQEYEAYKKGPETASDSFKVKLLLVMSNAAFLYDDAAGIQTQLRDKARRWIQISQNWLSAPIEKDRLTLDGLQAHCLLLLARQVNCVGPDLVWIAAGSLMRMAIQMGLHQDPDRLGEMTHLQGEIRRRLWYTIMEINLQASLDSGMRPMVTTEDFDTRPPANLNDEDLEKLKSGCSWGSDSAPTRTSFQCILANSIALRLEATKVINVMRKEPAYDHVLDLGKELMVACRNATIAIDAHKLAAKGLWRNDFPYTCCDHLHRRFLLCLHLPYAVKAAQNPMYTFSSKVGLEAALDIVSLLEDDTYRRLMLVGGGMFRDVLTRAAMLIFLELISQLENDSSSFAKMRNQERREPLLKNARTVVQYAQDRLWYGETNVKAYMFVSVTLGQVNAMLTNSSIKDAIVATAHENIIIAGDILRTRAASLLPGTAMDPDLAYGTVDEANSLALLEDIDLDFMGEGNIDSGVASSWFLQHWGSTT